MKCDISPLFYFSLILHPTSSRLPSYNRAKEDTALSKPDLSTTVVMAAEGVGKVVT
jgi:hypothetical protein